MFEFLKNKEVDSLKSRITYLEDKELVAREAKRIAEDQLAEFKHKTKLEQEDIKHMVKMKEEKQEIELDKKKVELEREHFNKIEVVKDDYRLKLEDLLKNQIKDAKESHQKLMEHMPKIEAMFSNQEIKKS
jgi:CRISPR/Cas system CSM-associated protein Csm4 (group 5 of RAMP superfamily)